MPKFHTLVASVKLFAEYISYWGCFKGEQLENSQTIGKYLRTKYAINLPVVGQVCSDHHHAWLRNLSKIYELQGEAEETTV